MQKHHSKSKDRSRIGFLLNKGATLKQGERSVSEYSGEVLEIYDELDYYRPPIATTNFDQVQQDRTYHFLQGLRPEFEGIRSQLYNREVELPFEDTISAALREESRMLELKGITESSAYSVSQPTAKYDPPKRYDQDRSNKEVPTCHFCKRKGHIKEKCWKLHGRPPQHSQAHYVGNINSHEGGVSGQPTSITPQEVQKMIREEMLQLKNLLTSSSSGSIIGSTSVAMTGKNAILSDLKVLLSYNDQIKKPCQPWILDSGATDHMTPIKEHLMEYTPFQKIKYVKTADGTLIAVNGYGTVKLGSIGSLDYVLYVPNLFVSLVSVQRLAKNKDYTILFDDIDAFLCHKVLSWRVGIARVQGGLYYLPWTASVLGPEKEAKFKVGVVSSMAEERIMVTHKQMGHPSFSLLKELYPSLFKDVIFEHLLCESCQLGQMKRNTYQITNKRCIKPFSLIHCDIWGPAPTEDLYGYQWFLIFVDDHSRFTWVELLKSKSETTQLLINFTKMIERQFETKVKGFRTDNAKDFCNNTLKEFFEKKGIRHETSCPYTPQQNGLAERKIGDIMNKSRTLLIDAHMPRNLWGFSVMTSVTCINRIPSKTLDMKSPIEVLELLFPTVKLKNGLKSRIFGCVGYTYSTDPKRDKLSPKAHRCVFVGYSSTQKGYKLYHPITKRVFVSKDVIFDEAKYYYNSKAYEKDSLLDYPTEKLLSEPSNHQDSSEIPIVVEMLSNEGANITSEKEASTEIVPYTKVYVRKNKLSKEPAVEGEISDISNSEPKEVENEPLNLEEPALTPVSNGSEEEIEIDVDWPIAIRKGQRKCVKPLPYNIVNYLNFDKVSNDYKCFLTSIRNIDIPNNVSQALQDPNWKKAMDEEMRALDDNQTWELVRLPKGKKPVGCRWVYTIKCNSDGTLERYKARLVARGYTQTYGIDYLETFAPVAKMNSIRILISLAVNLDWELHQYDIKNAFLYGELKEEIYMDVPPGYASDATHGKVCRLKKSLYGLKQSPRAWFGRFTRALKNLGYHQCNGDHTLFFQHPCSGGVVVLIVYVDDIIITGNNEPKIKKLEEQLEKQFEIKKLGPLKYFLGIEFARSSDGILMTQHKYILDLLEETKHLHSRINDTPIESNHRLTLNKDDPKVEITPYQKLIGKLCFLSHTRPDTCYAANVLSQFMHSPRKTHYHAAFRVLRYLKGTVGLGIAFRKTSNINIRMYTDSDFAGSLVDRRSTTGYCTFLGGNLISWRSKKQSVVSKSSTEAEFRALSKGIDEGLWIKFILRDLKIQLKEPILLLCDNKSAIYLVHDPVYHDRVKHVDIDRFYIQDHLEKKSIRINYVRTEDQCADIFTKGLPARIFFTHVNKLGMRSIHSYA